MKNYTITITRQFGSLGRPIAQKLAEILDYDYYDRDIVDMAAKKLNLPISVVGEQEEKAKSKWYDMKYPLGINTTKNQDIIFKAQETIITDLAKKGPAVFVGRCSDYILRYKENVINVAIYAPYEKRVENCIKVLNIEGKEAMQTILEVDKARDKYHKTYANYLPFDHNHKDLMLDSSRLGVEGTAQFIADYVRNLEQAQ